MVESVDGGGQEPESHCGLLGNRRWTLYKPKLFGIIRPTLTQKPHSDLFSSLYMIGQAQGGGTAELSRPTSSEHYSALLDSN